MAFFDFLHIFTDLFNSAARAWHKLEPDVQKALVHGSGVVDVINKNVDKTPQEVFDLITSKFPDLTKENLEMGLSKVADGLKIAQDELNPDLLTTLQNIQKYLATLQGKFWESASSIAAQIFAFATAPESTPFSIVVSLIEWVFRKKIK